MKRFVFFLLLLPAAPVVTACLNLNLINYVGKGYEAYQKGDLDGAEQFFRSAVKRKPRDPIGYNNLAVVLMDLDKTEEAVQHLKFATILSKTPYASPHINLARAYFELGKLDAAKEHGEKGIAIDRGNPLGLLVMADIYCARNENLQNAREYALTATAKVPEIDKGIAWSTLAEAEYKLKNLDAAAAAIDTALTFDTDNAFYRQQKALYRP